MIYAGATALLLGGASAARADDATMAKTSAGPTFFKDVLPIMQKNCQDCHRPEGLDLGGMIAPMSLQSFEEVRPWAKSIARVVKDKEMPPWHAAERFRGVFEGERTLTDDEIHTIVSWVQRGTTRGNPGDAPTPIEWPESKWAIGEPDLILTFNKPFFVKDEIEDLNINLGIKITAEQLPRDSYITAVEFKPDSAVVHHIIGYSMPPATSDTRGMQMIGGIAPGSQPTEHPEGYGVKLHAGSRFVFQMHYHKEPGPGTGVYDQSSIAFKFAKKPVTRIYIEAVGNPREMYIPAGQKTKIMGSRTFSRDVEIIGMLPHMHLRGDSALYRVTYPDGTQEDLLEVPKYDFNWQTGYGFNELKKLPAGTKLEVTLGFDNTAEKFGNPDATVDVSWGSATTDEMNLGWMTWAYVEPTENDPIPRAIGGGNDNI